MDRTKWQLGSFDINALVLGVTYKGVAFPLLFRLLPKRGDFNISIALILAFFSPKPQGEQKERNHERLGFFKK